MLDQRRRGCRAGDPRRGRGAPLRRRRLRRRARDPDGAPLARPARGLAELARVAPRQVLVSWDRDATLAFWLCRDYLPELERHVAGQSAVDDLLGVLDVREVRPLLVPRDCADGFLGAGVGPARGLPRPDGAGRDVRLALLDQDAVDAAMARLARDLDDGTWHRRNAELGGLDAYDAGFRLVVGRRAG